MSKRMPVEHSVGGWMQQIWAQARLRRSAAQAAGALSALAPALVLANPTGGQVVAGSATIGSAGNNGVIVNQSSQRVAIDWQQFSIGANQYVRFVQPNSSSVVLNRVTGSNPSNIFGSILANGQVFLINPNGILFAPGSTLDVSSLTASTLDISDTDFMAGRYVFSKDNGAPDASVVNQGNVQVSVGGYVVLAGDYVENDGVINAVSGKVLLAAGGGATLTLDNSGGLIGYKIDAPTLARLAGVDNTGTIVADGGAVIMTADVADALTATAVNNSGLITAHSVSQQGGEIVLLSEGGGIENSGTLDASATQAGVAGGTVVIRGNGHTQLRDTSVIDAEGDAAKGGFIEVSGHELSLRGRVTAGKGGTVLLDPFFLHIVDGSSNLSSASTNNVGVGWIQNQLNNGSNVVLTASDSIVNFGHATRFINASSGAGNLSMHVNNNGAINLTGLTINILGGFVASVNHGDVTTGDITAKYITITGAQIDTGKLVAAASGISLKTTGHGGGSISINGAVSAAGAFVASVGGPTSGNGNINISGALTAKNITLQTTGTDRGDISVHNLHATGPASSGFIIVHAQESTAAFAGGNVTINGSVTAAHGNVIITAAGGGDSSGGNITVTGAINAAVAATISGHYIGTSTGDGGGHVKLANVSGTTVIVQSRSSKPSVSVGNITAVDDISISAGKGIVTAGSLDAVHGSVQVTATEITTGPVTAGTAVKLFGDGSISESTPVSVKVNGAVIGNGVTIQATGYHGGTINVTGSVNAGTGEFSASAHNLANGSGGVIQVGKITAGTRVVISADGGGEIGGTITTGAITAGGTVSIDDLQNGTSGHALVQTGAISAGGIVITVTGKDAKFTAPSLRATGPSSSPLLICSCESGQGGTHAGYIYAKLRGNAGSASFDVTGIVKSAHGEVNIDAGAGAINTGNITAGFNVFLTGNDINVGSITAGTSVSIIGNSVSAAAHIKTTGLVKGKGVYVSVNGASSSTVHAPFGGSIDLAGGVSASANGITIYALASNSVPMKITTGALEASAGNILVKRAGGSGDVTINGSVSASAGSVTVLTKGRSNISITGDVTAKKVVELEARNPTGSGASLTVGGNISGSSVVLVTDANSGGNITVTGNITAAKKNVSVTANSSSGGHGTGGNISIGGNVKASSGSVFIAGFGGGTSGGNVKVGKVTAKAGIDIFGSYDGSTSAGVDHITVQTGNLTGEYVSISATGPAPIIKTGTITANGTVSSAGGSHHDFVKLLLNPTGATAGQGSISIGGLTKSSHGDISINASGGAVKTRAISADDSGDIDVSGSTIHVGGVISALGGSVCLTGQSASSHAMKITVTGTITAGMVQVKASPGSLAGQSASINLAKVVSSLSGGIMISAKTAAAVKTQINIGSIVASHSGHVDITQQGSSGGIKVAGPITVTNASVDITASGGSISVGAITATENITLTDNGNHGGGISVGGDLHGFNVSVAATGHAGADIKVVGKIIASDSVTVNASAGTHGGGNVDVTGLISAGNGVVDVTAHGGGASGGRVQLGNVTATGSISIGATYTGAAAGFTMQLGKLTGKQIDVSMTGKAPTLTVNGLTATGTAGTNGSIGFVLVSLSPTNHTSGSMSIAGAVKSTHGDIRLNADEGVLNMGGSISAAKLVSLSGGQLHLGNVTAGSHISISAFAAGNHAASISAPVTDLMVAKFVDITIFDSAGSKGAKIAIGGVTANGAGTIGASGQININVGLPTQKVTVSTGALTAKSSINVQIQDASGSASLGRLDAPVVLVKLAQGNLKVGQLVQAGASIKASNGSITDSTTGNLDLTGETLHAADGVHLKATGNITLNGDSFGGSAFSASAGGNLIETSANPLVLSGQVLKAGKQLVLSANTIDLGGAKLTASSIQLSATSINNASAHGSITAAKGTIHATHGIFLVGENINVSGAGPLISAASVDLDKAVVSGTGVLSIKTSGDLEASDLILTAGGLKINAGHDADLSGADIDAPKAVSISAVHDVNISGAQIVGSAVGISAGSILDGTVAGKIVAGTGGLTLKSKGGIQLAGETLNITGAGLISAAGSLGLAGAKFSGVGATTLQAGSNIVLTGATLALPSMTLDALGGSIDLTGASANAGGQLSLQAKQDIILKGMHIDTVGFTAKAGGSIDLTSASVDVAKQMVLQAEGDITLSGAHLTAAGLTAKASGSIDLTAATATATVAGQMTLQAKGDITLGGMHITAASFAAKAGSIDLTGATAAVTGQMTLQATGDIILSSMHITAASLTARASGSVDLTGATAVVKGQMALQAKDDIILSGVHITTGIFAASASGTIHNGGAQGAITAKAIKVEAKKDIDLSSTVITLGSGALTGVSGDTVLLQLLAEAGLKPASATPNGAFMAGGSLTLGTLDITGNYLVLQGSSISILGAVTAPARGLLVEVRPTDPAASIGVQGQAGTGQAFNISNQGFFALFPGDTIVIGDDAESGDVFIGDNGPFTLAGGTNLLFDTTGTITGLGKITSTGLVGSLETVAAAAGNDNVVTAGEIDPSTTTTSLGDQTDKKRLGNGGADANGEGPGGTISQDTGNSSVCH